MIMFKFNYKKKNNGIIISTLILLSLIFNPLIFSSMNPITPKIDNFENNSQESFVSELNSFNLNDNNNLLESEDLRYNEKTKDIIDQNPIRAENNTYFPEVNILNEDEEGLTVDFTISDIIVENVVDVSGEIYQKIGIDGGGHLAEIGKPELPTKGVYLEVPKSVDIDVVVKNSMYYEESGYNIYPSQKIVADNDESEINIEKNITFYEENKFFPINLVELNEIGIIRSHRTALLIIYPVAYNPVSKIMRVYNKLEIDIKYIKNDKKDQAITQNSRDISRYQSNEFSSFLKSMYLNYDSSNEEISITSQVEADGADYLIITPDDFYDEIVPLAQHKSSKGLITKIVNLSTIGVNPSADDITEFIQDAYNSWNPVPTYLLLVGDSELLPPHYKTTHPYDGSLTPTDLYYATLDGTDYFPDIFMGRLPVKNEAELDIVVNKIIDYEHNFNQNDPWRRKVTLAAYDQSGRFFIDTCENISSFLETKDYDITKIYTGGSYTGTTQDVIDVINDGTFLVNHRDHGEWYGWGDPSFTVYDIEELNNDEMLPVMFSINCLSGRFDYSQDCFAEAILKAENKGVVGCIASTRVSYSGYNDELDKGFIASIWPDYQSSYDNYIGKSAKLGHILNFGKMYMYDKYVQTDGAGYPWSPSATATLVEFEMFTLFGDPELSMFKVDHDLEVSLEIPNNPNISNTYIVNATVYNPGLEDMSDINLYLYCDDQIVNDINIPILSVGDSITIGYDWTPQKYDTFNFTAYAPPKLEEFYLSNNRITKFATVIRDLSVNLEVPVKAYLDESYLINATIKNNGLSIEKDVKFNLKIDDDIKNFTCIPTLEFKESYTLTYNWTPDVYGLYNITCDTPIREFEFNIINNVNHEYERINPIIFKDDFEKGLSNWNSLGGLWHFTSIYSPWPNPCYSPNYAMWFGRESTGNFQTGHREYGSFISNSINLSQVSSAYLDFYHWMEKENLYFYDVGYVFISTNGTDWDEIYRVDYLCDPWENVILNISSYCGYDTVYIRFYFDTKDSLYNNYRGWLIDNVEIYTDDYSYKQKKLEYTQIPPSLTDEDVTPKIGYQDSLFTFTVTYSDFNNDDPSQINVVVNGTPYAMIKQEAFDYDYTDGCTYEYYTYLPQAPYYYTYYFNCSDGEHTYTTSTYNLKVHFRPTLTNGSITPKIGYADTLITFKVNYTDLDNDVPVWINVIIAGYSYSMSKQDNLDNDYTDGCIYELSIYLTPRSNNYSYRFYCSDDSVNSVSTGTYNNLRIHSKPTLTNAYLWRSIGYPDTAFGFWVTYTDLDNDIPSQINVIINGTPYAMTKQYYHDYNYADGCLYRFSTNLPQATYNYTYYFNCSDGEHSYTTSIYNNIRVHNKPTLTVESVNPKQGYENSLITFIVNYSEIDNEAPTQISVIINGNPYSMFKQNNLDNDYTDGCLYVFSTYLSPSSYNYTYWFQYSDDGVNIIYTDTYMDLKITENPALGDNNGDDNKSNNNKSSMEDDLVLPIIIGISAISALTSVGVLYYLKKRNILLFKPREKEIS